MLFYNMLLFLMLGDPTYTIIQFIDENIHLPPINLHMEKLCIGISLLQIPNMGTVLLPSPLKHRKAKDPPSSEGTPTTLNK